MSLGDPYNMSSLTRIYTALLNMELLWMLAGSVYVQ